MFMLTSEEVRSIRQALGKSQTEFAFMLGVSANTIARWESGDRYPRRQAIVKLNELAKKAKVALAG